MSGGAAYSAKAQPFLDAIAQAAFASRSVQDWLLRDTPHAAHYAGATSLHVAQAAARPTTKQPFYCNYWCGRDARCTCRPEGSTGLETDLMLFLGAGEGRRLAIHVEFKHAGEQLRPGQAEAYPMRAACWAGGNYRPGSVMPHDDWLTAIFCGDDECTAPALAPFQRRIGHGEARGMIPGYPA
jgi:hypothetical protein